MNWVKKCKLLATEAIRYNECLYNDLDKLWQVLHQSYNTAQERLINIHLLDKVSSHQ